jgi:hypothetical protein
VSKKPKIIAFFLFFRMKVPLSRGKATKNSEKRKVKSKKIATFAANLRFQTKKPKE